ncbi:hypothetical protein AQ490_04050 [Wenjunlia vitaminophila]|uniref:Uncharacterized protein n=1 Tax=Wenjunlia vitaminophila TaxID=76728 RepID=A0A0T6LR05_WENVI|nr:hypothetical protein [Wenjunlia vitaminophila]KRV48480.1 hypothetical protein AQ490_04050 [Wenjunlia vitaminophila]
MSDDPWTIERVCEALRDGVLVREFLDEINKAPAHQLLHVFTRWQVVAGDIDAAVRRGRELATYEDRGEDLPGQWVDVTDRVREEAATART